MLELRPVRTDPRLLLICVEARGLRYVALDAWEIRGLGSLPREQRALALAIWRVLVQSKASHVLVWDASSGRRWADRQLLARHALKRGLPFGVVDRSEGAALARAAPAATDLMATYPELRHLCRDPRGPWLRPLRVAVGALFTRSLPPRHYVPGLHS